MTYLCLALYSFLPSLFSKGVSEETASSSHMAVIVVIPIEAVCFSLNRT